MHTAKLISLAIAGLAFLPVAFTAEDIKPYSCRNGSFPSEQRSLQLARFAGAKDQRLYFYKDDKGCPDEEKRCRARAYVVPGDELLISKTANGWACAWFHGKKQETVGWIRTDRLAFLPNEKDDRRLWIGTWKDHGGATIKIAEQGEFLGVEGNTLWHGGMSPAGHPVVHTGDIEGTFQPIAGRARLTDRENICSADFVRIGRYLVVHDNGRCGGVNVRFDGVYTKTN
jgi:hypothetical protein